MNDKRSRLERLSPERRRLLERRLKAACAPQAARLGIPRSENDCPRLLSFGQERLWFLEQFDSGNVAYNRPANLRFIGRLDVASLDKSLNEILRRHEILRSRFQSVDGQPFQLIQEEMTLEVPLIDLSNLPSLEREPQAEQLAIEEARRPFDLAQGPLVRARLIKFENRQHILLLTLHHAVFDGWSHEILRRELAALYASHSAGEPSNLPIPPMQYADFATWQRNRLSGKMLQELVAFWKAQLHGAPARLNLPTDKPRPSIQTHAGRTLRANYPVSLWNGIERLSHSEQATPFMTLLGAFQVLLGRYAGEDDVVVGCPIAGRTRWEFEDLIGFFINMLVLRTDLSGNPTFREVIGRIRATTLEALTHQELSFEKLVEALNPARNFSYTPLFQVMFQFRNYPTASVELPDLKIEDFKVDFGIARYDLAMNVASHAEGMTCEAEYRTDLFEQRTIERMLEHYRSLLEAIVADPDRPIARLAPWNETA